MSNSDDEIRELYANAIEGKHKEIIEFLINKKILKASRQCVCNANSI